MSLGVYGCKRSRSMNHRTNTERGPFTITRQEYLGDIISSSSNPAYATQTFAINPGILATFPYLASIAQNYLSYKISDLAFHFKTQSGMSLSSTNTQMGKVAMSLVYEPTQAQYLNWNQQQNSFGTETANIYENLTIKAETTSKHTAHRHLYVRGSGQPSNTDLRLYDFGYLQISTQGLQNNSMNVGELWIEYTVELYKPVLYGGLQGNYLLTSHYRMTGITSSLMYGVQASISQAANSQIPITFVSSTGVMTLPTWITSGTFMLVYTGVSGNGATAISATVSGMSANVTGVGILTGNPGASVAWDYTSVNSYSQTALAGQTQSCTIYVFQVTGALTTGLGPSVTITVTTAPAATALGDLFLMQINSLIST